MTEASRAKVALHFSDGNTIDAWTQFSCVDSFTDPIGHLEFEARPPPSQIADYRSRLAKGQLVTLLVNNARQGGFLIQDVSRKISPSNGVTFSIVCKTPLITPYEGSVDPELSAKYPTDASVLDIVRQALAPYGFTQIAGDAASHLASIMGKPLDAALQAVNVDALKHKEVCAHEGETAYQFCARIFIRLGLCLRAHADGSLLLTTPNYDQAVAYSLVQGTGDGDPLEGDIEIHETNGSQFSEAVVRGARPDDDGQTQASRPSATIISSDLFPTHPAYSSYAANYKPKFVLDKQARDVARCASVAKGVLGSRAANAFVVQGNVDGLISQTGRVWSAGTMAHVKIDLDGLNEDMFMLERTLRGAAGLGQLTSVKLIPKGAIVLGDDPTTPSAQGVYVPPTISTSSGDSGASGASGGGA